jgi:hypothetical protein
MVWILSCAEEHNVGDGKFKSNGFILQILERVMLYVCNPKQE